MHPGSGNIEFTVTDGVGLEYIISGGGNDTYVVDNVADIAIEVEGGIDLGGIDHSAASLTVPSAAEAIVFVVTLGRSRRTTLEQAVAVLGHSGARLSGVILVKGQGYRYLATTSR